MFERFEIAPGVTRHLSEYAAVYTGTPATIAAAGLALARDIPDTGCRTINPDGTRAVRGQNYGMGHRPGKKTIVARHTGGGPVVQVFLSLSVAEREALETEHALLTSLRFPRLGGGYVYLGPRPSGYQRAAAS